MAVPPRSYWTTSASKAKRPNLAVALRRPLKTSSKLGWEAHYLSSIINKKKIALPSILIIKKICQLQTPRGTDGVYKYLPRNSSAALLFR